MILLSKDYGTHKAGDTIELEAAMERQLIADGYGTEGTLAAAVAAAVAGTKVADTGAEAAVAQARTATVSTIPAEIKTPIYSNDMHGFGLYARDIAMASTPDEDAPERLVRYQRQVQEERPFDVAVGQGMQARGAYGSAYMSDTAGFGAELIPDEMVNQIFSIMHDSGVIYNLCTKIPVEGNTLLVPHLVETDREEGAGKRHGGITAEFLTAGWQKAKSKPTLLQETMTLKDLVAMCPITDALLDDNATMLGTFVQRKMAEAVAFKIDRNILRSGTGTDFDEGTINSISTLGQPRETVGTITWNDICDVYATIHPPLRKGMVWLLSVTAEAALLKLQATAGFPIYAGGTQFPSGTAPAPNTLLGKPVIVSEHCAAVGSVGDIVAANFAEYIIAQKSSGPKLDTSIHLLFDYNIKTYRIVIRINGQPWWTGPLTLDPSDTVVSWGAYLAEDGTGITTF